MKINTVTAIEELLKTVQKCKGDVYLNSPYGDRFNLKSTLSMYVGVAALIKDHSEELELFCADPADEPLFYQYFTNNPEVLE